MDVVLVGVIVAVVGAATAAYSRRKGKRSQDMLAELASALGGTRAGDEVSANCDGAAIQFRHETRGDDQLWTEIDVDVPRSYPFSLNVRRHTSGDHSRIETAEMVDVVIGNPAFDNAFLIEGAPADVVRHFFDPALCRLLDAHPVVELTTHRDFDRAFVRFAVRRRVDEPEDARELIDGVARIPLRLRASFAEADREIPAELDGGPYRQDPSSPTARDVAAARESEVERLRAKRKRRSSSWWWRSRSS